jgi:adenine/guanine/hypoxanthine permease
MRIRKKSILDVKQHVHFDIIITLGIFREYAMNKLLNSLFRLDALSTNPKKEIIAGATTFLTMIYIVPLNGIIMSAAGMPVEAVITATALVTIISTMVNGFWSNTPIAMSVGLGLNSYFAFSLVAGEKLHWQTVLGIVFLSGVLFLLLTLTRLRKMIMESISHDFKMAISAGIGLFIAFIGLKEMGIIVSHPATTVALGNLGDKNVLLGIGGVFILMFIMAWKIRGAFIIGIILTTLISFILGITAPPEKLFSLPGSISPIFMELDILSALKWSLAPAIVTFMLTDLFDSIGTLAGVGYRAGIFSEEDTTAIQKTLEADAAATVIGSLLGVSTTTSFIESAAGVEEGGRTGLTAVVTGLLFVATLFMLPFFKSIPANAIYPVLVMVGVFMFSDLKNIDFSDFAVGIPAFLIIVLMPLTFSITKGLAAGFISHVFITAVSGRFRELNPVVVILALVSVLAFVLG